MDLCALKPALSRFFYACNSPNPARHLGWTLFFNHLQLPAAGVTLKMKFLAAALVLVLAVGCASPVENPKPPRHEQPKLEKIGKPNQYGGQSVGCVFYPEKNRYLCEKKDPGYADGSPAQ